jgi:hypothetical protein
MDYIRYITTADESDSTVTVSSRHRSRRAAARTGRRVIELTYHSGLGRLRTPHIGDRLGLYSEPGGAVYALAPLGE